MDVALVGLVGVLVGVVGGYVTARANAKANATISEAERADERERDRRQLALALAELELKRNPDTVHTSADYAAVLIDELRRLDTAYDAGDEDGQATVEFRSRFFEQCVTCGPDKCRCRD